jgi:D-alanyl-D-alanine carboxypeptidase/D-alanyl-D-alanine-endopeptidase (penicillin-binding protein 4)
MRYLIVFIAFASALFSQLPQAIEDFIYKNKIKKENIAILITNKNTSEVIASLNEYKSFKPASVAKIATTYAALLELGKNFRWPTQFFYNGTIKDGVLNGDLVVKGYGDPTLNYQDLDRIAKKIRNFGIKKITGFIAIDRSFFDVKEKISSGFDKNFVSEYNAMPDCLMYNDHLNVIKINPKPGKIEINRAFGDSSFKIYNKIKPVNSACRGKNAWPKVRFLKEKGSYAVELSGSLSTKCRPFSIKKVLSKSYMSFYYSLKYYLNKNGVEFNGGLKAKKVDSNDKLLITHFSKPLIEIVAKTLKKSNNLYARHIFLLLGAKMYGEPATLQKGQMALRAILETRGLFDSDDFIANGSGLSRKSRLKVATVSKILDDAYRNYGEVYEKSLSIAGVDGTLKKRFRYSIVKNRAFMKTGTLKRAKNIAGFVHTIKGNLYNTVIFYNGAKIWLGRDLQNKIITWLVEKR